MAGGQAARRLADALVELSPLAVERLADLLGSADERVSLERPRRSSTGISVGQQFRPTSACAAQRALVEVARLSLVGADHAGGRGGKGADD
jgi:hypothetical protein